MDVIRVLLQRAKRLPPVEIDNVLRRIRMYDPLLEEDPWVQEFGGRQRAEGKAEGRAEGKAEGRVEGFRSSIQMMVQIRFPGLSELVRERLASVQDVDRLQRMFVAMSAAENEAKARQFLLAWRDDEGQ